MNDEEGIILAQKILDDRRNLRMEWADQYGDSIAMVATSALFPGFAAISDHGCDPILVAPGEITDLIRLLEGDLPFPLSPRPCEYCGEVEHTVETCEMADGDPTEVST